MSTLPKGLPAYASAAVATASAAAPPRRVRGLANVLVDHFCAQVRDRVLSPGDKLPTESENMRAHDVSRTVVPEAPS